MTTSEDLVLILVKEYTNERNGDTANVKNFT